MRFFDCALKGVENGFLDEPRLVSFMQERIGPATSCAERPGRWVSEPAWPSPNVTTRVLSFGAEAAPRSLRGLQLTGLEGGVWCGDGGPADLPGDQRTEDGASLCWDFDPLEERLELLGHAAAVLELEADRPNALVAVRLCDVAPDGSSSLIARGVLNLAHREGHDRVVALAPGDVVAVRVPMQSTAYAVPAGHALRLAVSPTYWPWVWPSPEPVTLTVSGGAVELPVRRPSPGDDALRAFDVPEWAPDPPEEVLASGPTGRFVTRDLAVGAAETRFDWVDSRSRLGASATELGERNVVRFRLVEGDPLSAAVACEVDVDLARGEWRTRVEVRSTMACDREHFHVTTELTAYEGAERSFARRWTHEIARDGG